MDLSEIGQEAMIAAGSVVTERTIVPARHLAAGVPARVKKEVSGRSLAWVATSTRAYRELAGSYLQQGLGLGSE